MSRDGTFNSGGDFLGRIFRRKRGRGRGGDPTQAVFVVAQAVGPLLAQRLDDAGPDAFLFPPMISRIGCIPLAELRRQIALGRARAGDPENRFEKESVVAPVAAGIAIFSGKNRRYRAPEFIVQNSVSHPSLHRLDQN